MGSGELFRDKGAGMLCHPGTKEARQYDMFPGHHYLPNTQSREHIRQLLQIKFYTVSTTNPSFHPSLTVHDDQTGSGESDSPTNGPHQDDDVDDATSQRLWFPIPTPIN